MGQILPCLWIGDYSAKDVITFCQSKRSQYSDLDEGMAHRPRGMFSSPLINLRLDNDAHDTRTVATVDYPTPGILDRTTWRNANVPQLASDSLDNIHTKLRSTKAKVILVQCVSAHAHKLRDH